MKIDSELTETFLLVEDKVVMKSLIERLRMDYIEQMFNWRERFSD